MNSAGTFLPSTVAKKGNLNETRSLFQLKMFLPLRLFKGVMSRYLLSFLKLKRFSYQLNSKNNASVLLFKTIFWHWICSLSSVAPDGKDGYRFKLDKVRPILSSFNDVTAKIIKKLSMVSAPWWSLFLYNATGAFRVWIKALSNDFRTELTQNNNILQNPYR